MAKQVKKNKGANGYQMPDPLPKGEILTDIAKKQWVLGESIGQGGFGEIYSAQEAGSKSKNYPFVVKIEPHENGPLFVEINFYIRNAKKQEVEEFMSRNQLKTFGMPMYSGSGSHEFKSKKYRFLVMQKFGTDIWKLFLENGRKFSSTTVFQIGTQMLDVLEYIHEHGYVHADLKGANILLGNTKETENQCYLVDFGLATKYLTGKVFKPNPKKAHDGTIEYLSRDAHKGVPTRRGDLEILAFNLIQWLGCNLPWEKNLKVPSNVEENKEKFMTNIEQSLTECFTNGKPPNALSSFLNYITTLSFDSPPDYQKIRKMFVNEIEKNGEKLSTPLSFGKMTKRKSEPERKDAKKLKNGVTKPNKIVECIKQDTEDEYEGYTAEMKAIAMRKKTKKVVKKDEVKELNTKPESASRSSRRNVKPINYKE